MQLVDTVIAVALGRKAALTRDDVGLCTPDGIRSFCDAYARRVVERYLAGDLSWTDSDAAMNRLFPHTATECGNQLPDFAPGKWGR